MSSLVSNAASCLFIFLSLLLADPTYAKDLHVTTFRSLNLYPESFKWDPAAHHFVVGSYRLISLHSVFDAGVVETLINNPQLPPDVSVGGIAVDPPRGRLLAVIHATDHFPSFDALAAYDLRTRRRLFLARLPDDISDRTVANDVAVDPLGNAFVTKSAGNFIWKVDPDGNPSIFSASPVFFGHTSRCYWGYAFENLATEDNRTTADGLQHVDSNVEYCSVIKTKLGAHRNLMGAEMDCCYSTNDGKKLYVELKTKS